MTPYGYDDLIQGGCFREERSMLYVVVRKTFEVASGLSGHSSA